MDAERLQAPRSSARAFGVPSHRSAFHLAGRIEPISATTRCDGNTRQLLTVEGERRDSNPCLRDHNPAL
jgi:hypothetical protein